MEFVPQSLDTVLDSLSPLHVEWQDDMSRAVISKLAAFHQKPEYTAIDITALLEDNFDQGLLIARLFLGLSKDSFNAALFDALGPGGKGIKRFNRNRGEFINALIGLGLLDAMKEHVNRELVWSDVLVERLRSGRGSAISGQKRGREMEDFVERIVKEIYNKAYDARCNFSGKRGQTAKCDIAIPNKDTPRIIVESKAYNATGSKMTDIIGDIEKIILAKRHDTDFILVTDGLSWRNRTSDLNKIIDYQNNGEIFRIYTLKMADQLRKDLSTLKTEQGL